MEEWIDREVRIQLFAILGILVGFLWLALSPLSAQSFPGAADQYILSGIYCRHVGEVNSNNPMEVQGRMAVADSVIYIQLTYPEKVFGELFYSKEPVEDGEWTTYMVTGHFNGTKVAGYASIRKDKLLWMYFDHDVWLYFDDFYKPKRSLPYKNN